MISTDSSYVRRRIAKSRSQALVPVDIFADTLQSTAPVLVPLPRSTLHLIAYPGSGSGATCHRSAALRTSTFIELHIGERTTYIVCAIVNLSAIIPIPVGDGELIHFHIDTFVSLVSPLSSPSSSLTSLLRHALRSSSVHLARGVHAITESSIAKSSSSSAFWIKSSSSVSKASLRAPYQALTRSSF